MSIRSHEKKKLSLSLCENQKHAEVSQSQLTDFITRDLFDQSAEFFSLVLSPTRAGTICCTLILICYSLIWCIVFSGTQYILPTLTQKMFLCYDIAHTGLS